MLVQVLGEHWWTSGVLFLMVYITRCDSRHHNGFNHTARGNDKAHGCESVPPRIAKHDNNSKPWPVHTKSGEKQARACGLQCFCSIASHSLAKRMIFAPLVPMYGISEFLSCIVRTSTKQHRGLHRTPQHGKHVCGLEYATQDPALRIKC